MSSEALRLADELSVQHQADFYVVCEASAAELRRLHTVNAALLKALEVLELMADRYRPHGYPIPTAQKMARAAIALAKEQQ